MMKILPYIAFTMLILAACQGENKEDADNVQPTTDTQSSVNVSVPPDGKITLSVEALLPEDAACVIPFRISNGTEADVSVSMFGFSVTGKGKADSGNMFPQDIPAGEYTRARIIQIGQSCDAFDTITVKDVLCKIKGDPDISCEVTFEDSDEISFVNPN